MSATRAVDDGDLRVDYPSFGQLCIGIARGFAGAMLFSLPMIMTMEMWWLGFYVDPYRLALLLVVMVPLLVRLSRYGGIRPTVSVWADVADALVVVAIAFTTSLLLLWLLGVIGPGMPLHEIVGKTALQTFPASIGAMLARNQLGGESRSEHEEEEKEEDAAGATYWGELFLMGVGALFLSLNVSPTEEVVLIAFKMNVWQELGLVALSIALMHAFVYSIDIRGSEAPRPGETIWSIFARFAIAGYAVVVLTSLYVLWTFGRTDGTTLEEIISATVVLSFPGAIGAAAARLIL